MDFPSPSSPDAHAVYDEAMQSKEGREYLHLFGNHDNRVGVKMAIPGTCFFLLLDSSQETATVKPSSEVLATLFKALFTFLIIGGGMALVITFRISRPLQCPGKVMNDVANGDLTARYQHDKMGFEINLIGRAFNRMIDSIIHHMEDAKAERIAKELLAKELKIGHEIQKSILPRTTPEFHGVDIATGFQGAKSCRGFLRRFCEKPQPAPLCCCRCCWQRDFSLPVFPLCPKYVAQL